MTGGCDSRLFWVPAGGVPSLSRRHVDCLLGIGALSTPPRVVELSSGKSGVARDPKRPVPDRLRTTHCEHAHRTSATCKPLKKPGPDENLSLQRSLCCPYDNL